MEEKMKMIHTIPTSMEIQEYISILYLSVKNRKRLQHPEFELVMFNKHKKQVKQGLRLQLGNSRCGRQSKL